MVFEHETPEGTRLYFGKSARLKRELEAYACTVFYNYAFEEIITPCFSFLEHQQNVSDRHLIRLSSQNNHQISLRYDSTIDTIRTITKRLERATSHKKWFYIQPVFSYPTNEIYQIGAESIREQKLDDMIRIGLEILEHFEIEGFLQLGNVKVLDLCRNELGLSKEAFYDLHIAQITKKARFMGDILHINSLEDLDAFLPNAPMFLRYELERLSHQAHIHASTHSKILIAPLEAPLVDYYDDMVFKVFLGNEILLLGGKYKLQECLCCGFGIYTDNVIQILLDSR